MTTQTEVLKLALETAFDLGQQFKLQCEQARWHKGQRELADKTKLVFKQFVENTIKEALAQPTSSDYALGYSIGFGEGHSAGKALAQPEQEPVAHFGSAYVNENGVHITTVLGPVAIPQDAKLYTTPPQRNPLPYEKVVDLWLARFDTNEYDEVFMNFARAIEAAHGIKE